MSNFIGQNTKVFIEDSSGKMIEVKGAIIEMNISMGNSSILNMSMGFDPGDLIQHMGNDWSVEDDIAIREVTLP